MFAERADVITLYWLSQKYIAMYKMSTMSTKREMETMMAM